MKKIVICLCFVLLLAFVTNAQTKSMTGKVVSVERGMYLWSAIVVKVGKKSYWVSMECKGCNVKIIGEVDEVGKTVTFYYTRILRSSDGYDGEIKPTKIVEVKKSKRKPKRKN